METNDAHVLGVVPEGRDTAGEGARGQAVGVGWLRKAGEAVAVVCAAVLAGGGAGMLAGVALGAINPYALGLFGAAVGACVPALLAVRPWRRGTRGVRGG
jgi:hypothetical protein